MTGAHQLLQTFLDQCKTGNFAELRLTCEGGRLKASMFADLGPLRPEVKPTSDDYGSYGRRVSPSRARRSVKRAAERQLLATAGKTFAAEAKDADQVAAAGIAAPEMVVAGNAADKEVIAEIAASLKVSVEDDAAAKAAESDENSAATICDVLGDIESASTSVKPLSNQSCWNCEEAFTPAHQCDGSPEPVSEASAPKPPEPTVSNSNVDSGRTFAPRRGLNIQKFCVKCEQRHRAGQKCPCQTLPPL